MAKILRLRKGYIERITNRRRSASANPMTIEEGHTRNVDRVPLHR